MYALQQHHGALAAWALFCFMLCSWFKQFGISVTHTQWQTTRGSVMGCLLPLASAACVCVYSGA